MAIQYHRTGIFVQPLNALFDNLVGLTHFFHAHKITVVAIAVSPDGDFKLHLFIYFIGLFFTQVPFHAAATQHRTVKPKAVARSGDTTPIPTVRCFQMRLSVSKVSYSSLASETGGKIINKIQKRPLPVFIQFFHFLFAFKFGRLILRHDVRKSR